MTYAILVHAPNLDVAKAFIRSLKFTVADTDRQLNEKHKPDIEGLQMLAVESTHPFNVDQYAFTKSTLSGYDDVTQEYGEDLHDAAVDYPVLDLRDQSIEYLLANRS